MSEDRRLPPPFPQDVALPQGVYKVTLWGIGGAKLYEAYYPPGTSFEYVASHVGALQVTGFTVYWEEG